MRAPTAILVLFALGCGVAAADEVVPLPRPKPSVAAQEPRSFAEAAGPGFDTASVTSKPTGCDDRLSQIAAFTPLPRLIGPGECGGTDMVELAAVILPDGARVEVKPTAVLRCPMAESFAAWLREEAAPQLATLGSPVRAVENYDSYECRGRNRVPGAKVSEHGKGNAIDVRSFTLADGRRLEPTDVHVDQPLRVSLRESACHRFTTVLGPGSDGYHEAHIHLDVLSRHQGFRLCQWDVREPPATLAALPSGEIVPLPRPRPDLAGTAVKHARRL